MDDLQIFGLIGSSPIIDEYTRTFTITCFPEISLFNVPVIRPFPSSDDVSNDLKIKVFDRGGGPDTSAPLPGGHVPVQIYIRISRKYLCCCEKGK